MLPSKKLLNRKRVLLLGLLTAIWFPNIGVFCQTIAADDSVTVGEASYYSQRLIGKRTTSGERYDDKAFTAAHASYPLGTWLLVTMLKNNRSVVVRVNDRFRPQKGHLVDLSMAASKTLDLVRLGRAKVQLNVLNPSDAAILIAADGVRAVLLDTLMQQLRPKPTFHLPIPLLEIIRSNPDVHFPHEPH